MAAPLYRRVSTRESSEESPRNAAEKLGDKVIAFLWVIAAVIVAYVTRFFHVLLSSSSSANRSLLQIVALCVGINTTLLLYLILYLPKVKGLSDSSAWDVYCPRVVPTMTATGIVALLLLIRATWPVWGFLSPLIISIEALGAIFSLHFIPWC